MRPSILLCHLVYLSERCKFLISYYFSVSHQKIQIYEKPILHINSPFDPNILCKWVLKDIKISSFFQNLLKAEINPQAEEDIDKDLHRQFPFHEMFSQKGGNGQQDLRNILYAYAVYNPKDGYCQAQAPIAAVLLMHMPAEVKILACQQWYLAEKI